MTSELTSVQIGIPPVDGFMGPMLQNLTASLDVNRNILATDEQIQSAWKVLPAVVGKIPSERRDENLARMCVALAAGLFDSAVNYAWNAAVAALREKIRDFGFNVISQIFRIEFYEQKLLDMQDSELLLLCLRLNQISERGFIALNRCWDFKCNLSAAQSMAQNPPDVDEFVNFLDFCHLYALKDDKNEPALEIKQLIDAINADSFTSEQIKDWTDRIDATFSEQRATVIKMLHGIYCDVGKKEFARVSAIKICRNLATAFGPHIDSELINQHQMFIVEDEQQCLEASRNFFESLGKISLLAESEQHSVISSACRNLMGVHSTLNNTLNERPFAERLASLTCGYQIPESVCHEYVETVVTCSVGNEFGTALDADAYYQNMIKGFSPQEIEVMFSLPEQESIVGERIRSSSRCRSKFKEVVSLLDRESMPSNLQTAYEKWIRH